MLYDEWNTFCNSNCCFKPVLDFDRIEKGAEQKMPKYMEWYGIWD
jgi:uncharacterized YccA/Bax inhibitor family protein